MTAMVGIVGGLGETCENSSRSPVLRDRAEMAGVCPCARCFIAFRYRCLVTDWRRVSVPLVRRTAWVPRKVSL